MSFLDRVYVVMVETSMSGNIGSAARAMKTMGLSNLILVNPRDHNSDSAIARAAGASDIMEQAVLVPDLQTALKDMTLVMGASARSRNLPWPLVNPRQAAETGMQQLNSDSDSKVALVFGRERSGLTNEELALCHHHIHIPANPDYSSLNVAAAIQVLCYEFRMANLDGQADYKWEQERENPPASQNEMDGMFGHLENTLVEIGYLDPNKPMLLMQRLRRLFMRAQPDAVEINILRGIFKKVLQNRNSK